MNEIIKNTLHTLTYNQSLAFGYILCKKVFPDYALFSENADFGEPDILYSGLVALRKRLSGADNTENIEKLVNNLWHDEEIAPDTNDFPGDITASLALNAVSIFYHTFKYAITNKQEFITKVSEISLESVIMYYVVSNNVDQNLPQDKYNKIINNAVFVQSEIHLQNSIIEKIQTVSQTNEKNYSKIKTTENTLVENSLYSQFIYA